MILLICFFERMDYMIFENLTTFTGVSQIISKSSGALLTFYTFLDSENGKTFDVSATNDFVLPVGLTPMDKVNAKFRLNINGMNKYLNLVSLEKVK